MSLVDVSAGYGSTDVLRGVSLEIRYGEIFVLLGPNGAGKSSLLRVLTGRLAARGGGVSQAREGPVGNLVEFVPQDNALYPFLTARENCIALALMTGLTREEANGRVSEVLGAVGCSQVSDVRVGRLSGGFRRRVDIAVALMKRPAMLALDEPSAGLDAAGREALIELLMRLRAAGTGSIVVTHDFELGDMIADRIGLMIGGDLIVEAPMHEALDGAFGSGRIVEVELAAEPDLRQRRSLHSIGLEKTSGHLWAMRSQTGTDIADRLAALFKDVCLKAREIRIRAPSLSDLYRLHVQEQKEA